MLLANFQLKITAAASRGFLWQLIDSIRFFVCHLFVCLFVCFAHVAFVSFQIRAAVGVACYLAVLFRKRTCYYLIMEYRTYCNDAFLERIKTDRQCQSRRTHLSGASLVARHRRPRYLWRHCRPLNQNETTCTHHDNRRSDSRRLGDIESCGETGGSGHIALPHRRGWRQRELWAPKEVHSVWITLHANCTQTLAKHESSFNLYNALWNWI